MRFLPASRAMWMCLSWEYPCTWWLPSAAAGCLGACISEPTSGGRALLRFLVHLE